MFRKINAASSMTVVICTRDRVEKLDYCLRAATRLSYPNYEILVVENGIPNGSTQELAKRHGARYMNSPVVGLSRARNDGARACTTDLLAYIDDDALPRHDWLQGLAAEFNDPAVMAVAGKVLPLNIDSDTVRLYLKAAACEQGDRQERLIVDRSTPGWFQLTNFGGIGDGCNMCLRKTAFEHWRGFDERLGRGAKLNAGEEHFSFFQLVLLGYRCIYTPHAVIQHAFPDDQEKLRQYQSDNMANAVAYIGLLWAEFPETRGLLLKHLWSVGFGERRRARTLRGGQLLSLGERLLSIAKGIRLFRTIARRKRHEFPTGACHPQKSCQL